MRLKQTTTATSTSTATTTATWTAKGEIVYHSCSMVLHYFLPLSSPCVRLLFWPSWRIYLRKRFPLPSAAFCVYSRVHWTQPFPVTSSQLPVLISCVRVLIFLSVSNQETDKQKERCHKENNAKKAIEWHFYEWFESFVRCSMSAQWKANRVPWINSV